MPRNGTAPHFTTMDDLLERLGRVSPKRVRLTPAPGTATVADVVRILDKTNRLYELIDGTLVEKIMGAKEAFLASELIQQLGFFQRATGDRGMILGADGTLQIMPGMVRIPDVSFTLWDRIPGGRVPNEAVPDLVPDLAVEVLSRGNTRGEMARKLREYFLCGVKVVWFVDPGPRAVRVFAGPDDRTVFGPDDVLDGGVVLPGFRLPVADLFAKLPAAAPPARRPRKKRG